VGVGEPRCDERRPGVRLHTLRLLVFAERAELGRVYVPGLATLVAHEGFGPELVTHDGERDGVDRVDDAHGPKAPVPVASLR